ncbi:MAG: hypothetical protein OXH78_13580 [Acidimicrobiaceae bacterium]|nr:hypothetical protein [Acidimicrobiaceae bacterium]
MNDETEGHHLTVRQKMRNPLRVFRSNWPLAIGGSFGVAIPTAWSARDESLLHLVGVTALTMVFVLFVAWLGVIALQRYHPEPGSKL